MESKLQEAIRINQFFIEKWQSLVSRETEALHIGEVNKEESETFAIQSSALLEMALSNLFGIIFNLHAMGDLDKCDLYIKNHVEVILQKLHIIYEKNAHLFKERFS